MTVKQRCPNLDPRSIQFNKVSAWRKFSVWFLALPPIWSQL
jgi:hypothetical protein